MQPRNTDTDGRKCGIIICTSPEAREGWVQRLRKVGCNYFVFFRDVRGPAIQYGYAAWAATDCLGGYYVNR